MRKNEWLLMLVCNGDVQLHNTAGTKTRRSGGGKGGGGLMILKLTADKVVLVLVSLSDVSGLSQTVRRQPEASVHC